MAAKGFFNAFADVWMHEGVRTPMVDYCGALGHISPTDLGIKAAREALKRAGIAPTDIGSVITGNMAPGDFDQFFLPRHIGLYAYRVGFLRQFPQLPQAPLELTESLEQLRNANGGFDIEASIIHPSGISEHYLGQVKGGRIDIRTVNIFPVEQNFSGHCGLWNEFMHAIECADKC